MIPKDSSAEKQVWTKRAPDQRQLFASVDKWLAFLPYLSKPELDKCREVSEWTNQLIEKHSGGELKQRRKLWGLVISPVVPIRFDREAIPLNMDKWVEVEEKMNKIEAKAKQLTGETIYPYEPEDATVSISIAPRQDQYRYLYVKNLLDEKDALLIARLMPHIASLAAVFGLIQLAFLHTPELPADAPYGGSYFNPAVFSLPNNADGSGGGPVKFIAEGLSLLVPLIEDSPGGITKTAQLTVQCQELLQDYIPQMFASTLRLMAVARPLNAPFLIEAYHMEDGRLDEMISFFTDTVPGFESTVPRFRVTIDDPTAWPESLPKESAINPREEQLAERLYKFRRYNHETGEKLEIEVRGSFGSCNFQKWRNEMEGEAALRVSEMTLYFRPDDSGKWP